MRIFIACTFFVCRNKNNKNERHINNDDECDDDNDGYNNTITDYTCIII